MEGAGEFRSGTEREVDVLPQHLCDIGPGDFHTLREVGLGKTEFLHAEEYLAEECRADMINSFQISLEFKV